MIKYQRKDIDKDHPLTNKKIKHISTETIYIIESVHKMWSNGYFLCLLTVKENTDSHSQIFWQNISCEDNYILDFIDEANLEYSLMT